MQNIDYSYRSVDEIAKDQRKRRKIHDTDFVKDGLETSDIIKVVTNIREYIENNKQKSKDDIVAKLKGDYAFFAQRYPVLFEMSTKSDNFDFDSLNYFLITIYRLRLRYITSAIVFSTLDLFIFDTIQYA